MAKKEARMLQMWRHSDGGAPVYTGRDGRELAGHHDFAHRVHGGCAGARFVCVSPFLIAWIPARLCQNRSASCGRLGRDASNPRQPVVGVVLSVRRHDEGSIISPPGYDGLVAPGGEGLRR